MKIIRGLMVVLVAVALCPLFSFAFTNNEITPGGTGSATPTGVGTVTPVPVLHCVTGNEHRYSIIFQVIGGTLGTDGCYLMPANAASPCAAASPAPNASTKVGLWVPTGGTPPGSGSTVNAPSTSQGVVTFSTDAEWDAVCSAGSMSVSRSTLP